MEYPDQAWQCFAMRCLYMVRKVTGVHSETVFLPDTDVAPLPKNAHVSAYALLFRRSRALVSNKNPRFRMETNQRVIFGLTGRFSGFRHEVRKSGPEQAGRAFPMGFLPCIFAVSVLNPHDFHPQATFLLLETGSCLAAGQALQLTAQRKEQLNEDRCIEGNFLRGKTGSPDPAVG
jgi:hypothetical protein